LKRSV